MSEILPTSADIVSDLSEHEKLLLLRNNRKKSKEERQHERRQKREQNREKREYEKKRRRERHGKHRRDGLVQEHFIPVSIVVFKKIFPFNINFEILYSNSKYSRAKAMLFSECSQMSLEMLQNLFYLKTHTF